MKIKKFLNKFFNIIGVASAMLMIFVSFLTLFVHASAHYGNPNTIDQYTWVIIMIIASIKIGSKLF